MTETIEKNNYILNDRFLKKIETVVFDGEDTNTQDTIKQALKVFFLWNTQITVRELKNITTFKQLLKVLKEKLKADALTTQTAFNNAKTILESIDNLTDTEKQQLEEKYNTLTPQELDAEAISLSKGIDEILNKDKCEKEAKERIYQYTFIEYKIADKTLSFLVMCLALFDNIIFKNDSNRRKADRLTLEGIKTLINDLNRKETIKKPLMKAKNEYSESQELHGISIYTLTTILNPPSIKLDEKNPIQKTIINNYQNQVEQKIKEREQLKTKLEGLDPNSSEFKKAEKEITTLTQEINVYSKNIVKYMGGYYSVDGGETLKTTIDLDNEGFYKLDTEKNDHLAILPSRLLAKQTRWRQVLDGLIYLCLKDRNNAIYSLDITDEDIYYIMGEKTAYESHRENPTEATEKKLREAKKSFLDIVINELFLIRLNTKELKGNILSYSIVGDKLTITITNRYLNACINQNIGGIINYYAYETLKNEKDINALNLYKEIAREIYIKTIRENKNIPNEYNYKFSLSKLRKMGNYLSEEKIGETIEADKKKQKNKDIKDKIKNDLNKLYEKGLILITEIKGNNEFTIMIKSDDIKTTELLEHFKKVAEANGHKLLERY